MEQRRLTGLLVATALTVAGIGVVALYLPTDRDGGATAAPLVRQGVYTVDLTPTDPASTSVGLPERDTHRYSMLGVTWSNPKAVPHATIQVRTRSATSSAWTSWRTLEFDDSQGPDSAGEGALAGRGGTEPLWVGLSNGVAVRISGTGKAAAALPGGLRLDMIDYADADPGAGQKTSGARGGSGTGSGGQGGGFVLASNAAPLTKAASSAPVSRLPRYVSRAGWHANESLVRDRPQYTGPVKVIFVHHTAGTNNYSCADSPAIIRSIQAYQVLSRGWNDIGYNFLVDKCGTLFEGRRGGVTRPVLGAHTYGFNTDSAGVAVLGTYSSRKISPAAATTLARVSAYKLGQYGYEPSGKARLVESASDGKFRRGTVVSFHRISGHRDAVVTECPGNALYAQLAAVRTQATQFYYGFAGKPVTGGRSSGGTYYVHGTVTLHWTNFGPSRQVKRFELLVDGGKAGRARSTARAATVRLTDGRHQVAVRAVYGTNTRLTTPASTVVSDTVAPVFTRAPELSLRTGTVSTTSAPVTLNWRATDRIKLDSVAVTHPGKAVFGPFVTAWNVNAKVGVSRTWQMTARDAAGNTRYASVPRTPTLIPETAAIRSGAWLSKSNTEYLGGTSLASTTAGSGLTWTVTARAVGLIVSRGSLSGEVDILVDGKLVRTVDLRSSATLYRQLVWQQSFPAGPGCTCPTHIVSIVVKGTSGRPGVTVDGLIALT